MNKDTKTGKLARVTPLGLSRPCPFLINVMSVCCPTSRALRLGGVHSPPHAHAGTCRFPSAQGASLNFALVVRVTKTICNLFQYPNFKHRTCFFQNTLALHLLTRIQCLGWGQLLCTQPWKTHLLQCQVMVMVRGLTKAIGDLDSEGDADSEDTSEKERVKLGTFISDRALWRPRE